MAYFKDPSDIASANSRLKYWITSQSIWLFYPMVKITYY